MKKIFIPILLLLPALMWGQVIKRQVIASFGLPHTQPTGGAFCTAVTVGQPPNSGTASDGDLILRQGFQQPIQDDCPIGISFDVLETSLASCGIYYQFTYTGDINPNTTISWQFGSNASPVMASGATPPLVGYNQTGPQELSVTVSDGKCQKTVMQFVDVKGTPFMALVNKTDAPCFGQKGNIQLAVQNGTPPYQYQWNTGASTAEVKNLSPGQYLFTVTDANGCSFAQPVEITGSTQPLFVEGKLIDESCKDSKDGSIELIVLNAAQPVVFTWGDGFQGDTRDSLTKGIYKIQIQDAQGCSIDTAFAIRTFCELNEEDFIPDVFSPNGDGFNDVWVIPMLDQFPSNTVRIFNRWGALIWEATNGTFVGWQGTNSNGEEMPIGAYYYVIELNSPVTNKIFKGSVTIIK